MRRITFFDYILAVSVGLNFPRPLRERVRVRGARLIFLSLLFVLGEVPAFGAMGGFVPAKPGYDWKFPFDHGNHPGYQTEWWYYTGHLRDGVGKRYGFELTFFRQGLSRQIDNPSSFTATDLYFAHFALSDLGQKKFWYSQKINRPGPG